MMCNTHTHIYISTTQSLRHTHTTQIDALLEELQQQQHAQQLQHTQHA